MRQPEINQEEGAMKRHGQSGESEIAIVVIGLALGIIVIVGFCMIVVPQWSVWSSKLEGEAMLNKANQTKQILVTQAQAELDASKLRAQAIEIVGKMAQQYPEYREQEFIGAFAEALHNGNMSQIIYVPTEANIPIIEARSHEKRQKE